jgi:CBS domain-containing protein
LLERLLVANIFLVIFNLLPAFPMDGGRVLRALLAMRLEYAHATRIAGRIGQGMAVVFGLIGLFGNPILLFIALFVWLGASQESAAADMKSSIAGYRVHDAMLTEYQTLGASSTLGDAARRILAGSQQDFPIVEDGRVVGMLWHVDLFRGLRDRGENGPVTEFMRSDFVTVDARESLDETVNRMREMERGLPVVVVREGAPAGLLTLENLGEFYMIRSALGRPPTAGPSGRSVPPIISETAQPAPAR